MRADDRALADLAASVADGSPVDWQGIESKAPDTERRLVRHLRLVENIASLYRSIPGEEGDELPHANISEPPGPRWGRLVMLDPIGGGSSADVLRAWDTELHRNVALKLLKNDIGAAPTKEAHAKVLQEARRLARVRHAHVVQVYGAEEHGGQVGLWMELVRGESLEQILRARGSFGAAEAGVIGQELCAALAAVHGAGLLHRDVKAQNVLRESGGRIVLMDFGTGEELQQNAGTSRMAGTPLYLAPEIFKGQAASVESDLYSVGVLLFYLVTGQFPVAATSMEQLARAHAHHQRRRLRDLRPDLPSPFVAVVERALDSDPTARFHTAGEMEAALRQGLERGQQPAADEARAASAPARRRSWIAGGVLAAVVLAAAIAAIVWSGGDRVRPVASRAVTSVAILPLADVSDPPHSPYFADALTDQLISTLGQIESLRVSSRTSVMPFKDAKPSIKQVFDTLGVDAVVEGTVAVSPEVSGRPGRVRVNARLISAGGSVLWSRTFDRLLGETLALEAEVSRDVASGVHATVTPEEHLRLTQVRATTPSAEQAYFKGLHQLHQLGADNLRAAIEAFRRAIELDPNYAEAHAALARAHITVGFMRTTSQAEARVSALAAASRAAELDPASAAAHEVLADLKFYYDWDWAGAEASYRRAIDLSPSSDRAHSQYARFLIARGRTAEAREEADRAVALDPISAGARSAQALVLYYIRDYDRALEASTQAHQLDPGSAGVYFVQSRIHAALGSLVDAVTANERAIAQAGRAPTGWRAHLILLQALAGKHDEARAALRTLSEEVAAQNERIGPGQLAYIEAALGNRDGALGHLELAAQERDSDLLYLAVDPRVDSLRGEPRFKRLIALLGSPTLDPPVRLP